MSSNTAPSSDGQDGDRGNHPFQLRLGRKNSTEADDSSASISDQKPLGPAFSGGAKLTPYIPPQLRAALSKDSIRGRDTAVPGPSNANGITKRDFSNPGSPLAVKPDKLSFQRGGPTGVDPFDTTTSSSSEVKSEGTDEALSLSPDGALATNMSRYTLTARGSQNLASGQAQAGSMWRATSGRHLVGDKDAQKVYPHTACVFIANLPSSKTDEALEAEVTRRFSSFGTVYVKIKRDKRDMPFGFLQYTNDTDAVAAIEGGRAMSIFNRACRVEMAKANRTFVVRRHDNLEITVDDVMPIVAPYGVVSTIKPLADVFPGVASMSCGIFVEFAQFDCNRELVNHYSDDRTFLVKAFNITEAFREPPRTNADAAYLNEYQKGRKSIWVGNLTLEIDEERLRQLLKDAGEVQGIQLIRRYNQQFGSFAFVEFTRPDMVDVAIRKFNGCRFSGTVLAVEKKLGRNAAPRRINSTYVRDIAGRSGFDGRNDAGQSSGRGPTPRRNFTAAPAINSHLHAQVDMDGASMLNQGDQNVPTVYVTPHHGHVGRSAPTTLTVPGFVSSWPATPGPNAAATTTPGGGLAAPVSTQSRLAPPFGPRGYFVPSPGLMPPFGGFHPGPFGAFGGNPYQQQHPGFFAPQNNYYQDPASGLVYPMPPIPPPAMADRSTVAFGQQRSVSAMPAGVPAGEHLESVSADPLKPKKSVTFADTVDELSPVAWRSGRARMGKDRAA